jgi:hypothetical protein
MKKPKKTRIHLELSSEQGTNQDAEGVHSHLEVVQKGGVGATAVAQLRVVRPLELAPLREGAAVGQHEVGDRAQVGPQEVKGAAHKSGAQALELRALLADCLRVGRKVCLKESFLHTKRTERDNGETRKRKRRKASRTSMRIYSLQSSHICQGCGKPTFEGNLLERENEVGRKNEGKEHTLSESVPIPN